MSLSGGRVRLPGSLPGAALVLALLSPTALGQAPPKATTPAAPAAPATTANAPATPAAPAAPTEPACTDADLVRTALMPRSVGLKGSAMRVRDGRLATEGSVWNAPESVQLEAASSYLSVDLRRVQPVQHFLIQGDDNDSYVIEGSKDGLNYQRIWTATPSSEGQGLRSRFGSLPAPVDTRYLRVRGLGGDGFYSISELRVHCKQPKPWPPKLTRPVPPVGWKAIDNDRMVVVKGVTAIAATLVLLLGFVLPWRRVTPRDLTLLRPFGPFRRLPHLRLPGSLWGFVGRVRLRPRWWRDLTVFFAAIALLVQYGMTIDHRYGWAGMGVLLLWFVMRYLTGVEETSRGRLGRVAAVLVRPTWLWVALIGVVCIGAVGGIVAIEYLGRWTPKLGWWVTLPPVVGLLLFYFWLRFMAGPVSFRRTAEACLAVLGIVSLFSWWNFLHYHFDHYIHIWEHYHYYMGAKYGPELRYARLYECTAVADSEDGLRSRVMKRNMRALATDNSLGTTKEILAHPEMCKDHFTKERWQEFRKDIRFFRSRLSRDRWDQSQTDHGYNATPVWAIIAKIITDYSDLNWKKIEHIATIDSVLLLAMWLAVLWGFGWKPACVALIYWGNNFPARFWWNGGSFLRYDWMLWMVVGLCLMRRKWMYSAGIALTYATLLRVFPGFLVAAVVLKALYRMFRERRFVLSRDHTIFAAGCITALLVLVPISSWPTQGLDAWGEFAQNSSKHLKTALTNNMGLKTVLGFNYATRAKVMRNDGLKDPFQDWKDARAFYYHKRAPIQWALMLLFCIMLARAGDRSDDWVAACLGAGLIVMAAELTCYYYGFLLTYGLIWERRRLPGIAAALLAGATCFISFIPWNDEHFAVMSLGYVVVCFGVTAHAAFSKPAEPESGAQPSQIKRAQPSSSEPLAQSASSSQRHAAGTSSPSPQSKNASEPQSASSDPSEQSGSPSHSQAATID